MDTDRHRFRWSGPAGWTIFAVLAAAFLSWYFGRDEGDLRQSLLLVALLFPVAAATIWILSERLIPRYLLTRQYFLFGLYGVYTLIASVYLAFGIIVGTFIFVADLSLSEMNPAALDLPGLLVGVFLVVAIAIAARMAQRRQELLVAHIQLQQERSTVADRLDRALNEAPVPPITIRADRVDHRVDPRTIRFAEGLSDYVRIHTDDGVLVPKMRLRDLEELLSDAGFVRIHRSYLVSEERISAWTGTSVALGEITLPIGRTHRAELLAYLADRSSRPAS